MEYICAYMYTLYNVSLLGYDVVEMREMSGVMSGVIRHIVCTCIYICVHVYTYKLDTIHEPTHPTRHEWCHQTYSVYVYIHMCTRVLM